ncbi:MAG: class I SAM-dependent methyltransferase [Planctomycetota bacterium]|jgi:ubiquinone/menaquinone biosynthesis C-methylase UbiE
MNARFQRRIQRYGWDKAAECYEEFWSRQLAPAQARLLALAALTPGESVVDIACGTGLVTFPVAEAVGPNGDVLATDLSDEMVRKGTDAVRARGLAQVRFAQMDAEALDVPDGTFDVALDALGLMYVPDPVAAAREMLRVIRPGGRAVACVWGARSDCGWAEIFPIVDARVQSDVCPMFFHLGTGDALATTFRAAGFADVRVERIETLLHYQSADAALGAAFAGGPVALAYSKFDEATRESAHAEYLESIARYRVGTAYEIPGAFVLLQATRPSDTVPGQFSQDSVL